MNYPVLAIFFGFWFLQNCFFGWNGWPESDAELIADGITCLLLAMFFMGRP